MRTPALHHAAQAVRCKCIVVGVVGVSLTAAERGHGVFVGDIVDRRFNKMESPTLFRAS